MRCDKSKVDQDDQTRECQRVKQAGEGPGKKRAAWIPPPPPPVLIFKLSQSRFEQLEKFS